jgi:hypothetical protein
MLPTYQRFHARDLTAANIHFGLVVNLKFVALQRAPQVDFQCEAFERVRIGARRSNTRSCSCLAPSRVQSRPPRFSSATSRPRRLSVTADADARRDVELRNPGVPNGLTIAESIFARPPTRLFFIFQFFQQHHELVSPRRATRRSRAESPESLADFLQQHVSGIVPERVIDIFKTVEVDKGTARPFCSECAWLIPWVRSWLNRLRFGNDVRLS